MIKKYLTILSLFFNATLFAQQPEFYPPTGQEPPELTLFNIILYFVMPILVLVFYLVWRKSKKKKKEKEE